MNTSIKYDPFSSKAVGGYSNASSIDAKKNTRSYAASAYYAPARGKANLTVMTGAVAKKVLFGPGGDDGIIATGVSFTIDGKRLEAKANKEVILAAGAFQSPKILELSGIGNPELFKSLDNPVIVE